MARGGAAAAGAALLLLLLAPASAAPAKVFVLCGQSNMVGHGFAFHHDDGKTANGTLPYLLKDPRTSAEFSKLQTDGNWTVRDDVFVVYDDEDGNGGEQTWHGGLTVGYGGVHGQSTNGEIGPELGFGWSLGDALSEQVILIKTAWGGKSLDVDFRPPSSGGTVGPYYTKMVSQVRAQLKKLGRLFPAYAGSYELAGFAWHQGWNDGCGAGGADPNKYEADLVNLIKDVRKEFSDLPGAGKGLPFTVGVSGMLGHNQVPHCANPPGQTLEDVIVPAQLAVGDKAKHPEFAGTVASVETRHFFREEQYSPGGQCYHWMNNCESYWLVGKAMGEGMLGLLREEAPAVPAPPVAAAAPAAPLRPTAAGVWVYERVTSEAAAAHSGRVFVPRARFAAGEGGALAWGACGGGAFDNGRAVRGAAGGFRVAGAWALRASAGCGRPLAGRAYTAADGVVSFDQAAYFEAA